MWECWSEHLHVAVNMQHLACECASKTTCRAIEGGDVPSTDMFSNVADSEAWIMQFSV